MHTEAIYQSIKKKSASPKEWFIDHFESVVGEFPEIEEKKESEIINYKQKNNSLLKKHKSLRYIVLPVVFVLIIIDESYLRIRECVKNIDKSE